METVGAKKCWVWGAEGVKGKRREHDERRVRVRLAGTSREISVTPTKGMQKKKKIRAPGCTEEKEA